MKKYKTLPQVAKDQYEISATLSNKNYKLTEDSQIFRDKIVSFVVKNVATNCSNQS